MQTDRHKHTHVTLADSFPMNVYIYMYMYVGGWLSLQLETQNWKQGETALQKTMGECGKR